MLPMMCSQPPCRNIEVNTLGNDAADNPCVTCAGTSP